MSTIESYSPILQRLRGRSQPIIQDNPDMSPILARLHSQQKSSAQEPQPIQDTITSDPMAVDGLLQIGGSQNTGAVVPPSPPQETPVGAMTPFYEPNKAIAGDYGEQIQRVFARAKKAVDSGRSQRFPWTGLVAETPPEERNDTLLAIAQLSAQRGEYADSGTLSKVGAALSRGARQFKTSVDNTLGELVESVFGKTKIPGIEVVDGWGDSERLFEKAAERAAEQGDPLVNPNDPFWKRWTVQAAEMTPAMAAGAVTANPYLAASVWFAPIYDDARDELLEAGVDPSTARVGGAISAAVQAAVETFNLNPFKPKGSSDPVARGIREHVKNYLVGWTKELSEEFVQGGVQGATMAAATALDEQAPDLALGDQLRQKMGDAMQAGGPLAVMMLPGFIGGLPASRRESAARRWMANKPQEQVERVAEKAANGKPISRQDVPEVKDAAGRAAMGEEVAKAKPKYRWNPKTGEMVPNDPVPSIVQRIEEPGIGRASINKPHGIFTSPGDVDSPHANLGGQKFLWKTNPSANVLNVSGVPGAEIAMRRGAVSAGAGVAAARQLLGGDRFNALKTMSKSKLSKEASAMTPGVDYSGYHDAQEVMEALGVQLAKAKGYDAIWQIDTEDRSFSEYVAITNNAMSPAEQDIKPPAEGFGRPELANPGMTQEARDMMDQIDQGRKEAGVPQVEPRAQVEDQAKARLEADYEGEVGKILEGGAEPGAINTFLAREAFNTEATKAVRGDGDALIRANRLGEEYRSRRTEVARELGAGVDPILTPEQRLGHVMRAVAEVPAKVAKQIERLDAVGKKVRKQRRNVEADIEDAWKRLGAAFGGQLGANNVQAVAEATKAAGDLVVAYARKGVYAVQDIIDDLEAKRGVTLNSEVRDTLTKAVRTNSDAVRAERVRNEDARSKKRDDRIAKNREKGDKLIRQWGVKVEQFKRDLKNIHEIDLDSAEGLTNLEAATALQYLRSYKSDAIDVWLEFRRNAMLSAPDTHMLNNTSNTSHFMYLFGLRYPTEVVGRAIKGDKSLAPEVEAVYRNLFSMMNLRDAVRTARLAWKTEVDVWELREAERGQEAQQQFVSPVDVGGRGVSVKGRKGRLLRSPQRALLAADNFYKVLMGRAYVAMEAHRIATEQGYDLRAEPEAYDRRVQELMSDTSSDAWDSATHLVREGVFQEPTKAMQVINKARSGDYGRLWQLIIPFVTTPWNVMRRAAKMTPGIGTVGLAADIKSGNAKRISKGLADQAIGTLGWLLLAAMNDTDNEDAMIRFTGTENGMRRRKTLIDTSLHQPNSAYIGKHRIGLNRFDPFATWLGVAVDTIEEIKRAEHPIDAFKVAATYTTSAARSIQDKTWLQGVSDLFELMGRIADGEYRGALEYWSRSFVVSHVPNVFKSASRDADPYMRDMRIWGEGQDRLNRLLETARIQAGFDTDKDEWAYDLWGMPRRMQEINDAPMTDFAMRFLSPFPQNQQEPFIGTQMLMRWNMEHPDEAYWPGEPGLKYRNADGEQVYMNPEQKAQFIRLSGRLARTIVTEKVQDGIFNPVDKLKKVDRDDIKSIISSSRRDMRSRLAREWVDEKTVDDETIMKEFGIQLEP